MNTRERVRALLDQGMTCAEIARALGMAKSTVSYHKRRIGLPLRTKCNRRYDWDEVQRYYDEGHTVRECAKHFGFSSASFSDAVKRGAIKPRPQAMPLEKLLIKGPRNRNNIRRRLIAEGIKRETVARNAASPSGVISLSRASSTTATARSTTTGSRTSRSSAPTATASRTRGAARTRTARRSFR